MSYQPPFTITPKIINLISIISEQIGRLDGQGLNLSPQLRKQNRIQTIQRASHRHPRRQTSFRAASGNRRSPRCKTTETHPLIKSGVFHYELEFIHPFMDGNGRDRFYLLPIESLIKDQQERYYQVLEEADQATSSTVFIEFMLEIINTTINA